MVMNDDVEGANNLFQQYDDCFHITGAAVASVISATLGLEKEDLKIAAIQLERALSACEKELPYAKAMPGSKFPAGSEFNVLIANILLQSALTGFLGESIPEVMRSVWKLKRAYGIFSSLHSHMTKHDIHTRSSVPGLDSLKGAPRTTDDEMKRVTTSQIQIAMGQESALEPTDFFIACATATGYGLLSLIISLMPAKIARVLSVIGFKGNKTEALATLRSNIVAENFEGAIALIGLIAYYTGIVGLCDIVGEEEMQMRSLEPNIQAAVLRYPNSAIWKLQVARMHQEFGQIGLGIQVLESITTEGRMKQIEALRVYDLGFAHLMTLQWEKAADYFCKAEAANDWSKTLYHYIIGSCYYELFRETGDVQYAQKADERFRKAPTEAGKKKIMGKEIPIEVYIRRKVAKWSDRSSDGLLIDGITVSPAMELGHLFNSWKKLDRNLQDRSLGIIARHGSISDSSDDLMVRQLLSASVYRSMQEHSTALTTIELASGHTRVSFADLPFAETWAIPHVYYEHAAILWAHQGTSANEEVMHWIEKAKNFGDSELENRLSIKISTAQHVLSPS